MREDRHTAHPVPGSHAHRPAQPARLYLVDLRRTLLDAVHGAAPADYAFSTASLAAQLGGLVTLLENRLPTAETTADQLRSRSWWAGPQVYLIVDDYDLVTAASPDAMAGLQWLLPHATDIGLHVVLAGGARAPRGPCSIPCWRSCATADAWDC